jgi:hypothetical protein
MDPHGSNALMRVKQDMALPDSHARLRISMHSVMIDADLDPPCRSYPGTWNTAFAWPACWSRLWDRTQISDSGVCRVEAPTAHLVVMAVVGEECFSPAQGAMPLL